MLQVKHNIRTANKRPSMSECDSGQLATRSDVPQRSSRDAKHTAGGRERHNIVGQHGLTGWNDQGGYSAHIGVIVD